MQAQISNKKASASQKTDTTRLETFCDGIFAIAITLLIIDIHLPSHEIVSSLGLWQALGSLWTAYFAYVLSFIVIGIMWANHRNLFRHIVYSDHTFVTLNILLLLFVAFLPFPTSVLAEYLSVPGAQNAAVMLYGGTLMVTAIFYNALWRYASWNYRLLSSDVDKKIIETVNKEYLLGPIFYGIATVIAIFNVWISLGIHAFLAIVYMLPNSSRN